MRRDGRRELFGKVISVTMVLNDTGGIILKRLKNIPNYFENILLDEYVVMPNHIHFTVRIVEAIHESPKCELPKRATRELPPLIIGRRIKLNE